MPARPDVRRHALYGLVEKEHLIHTRLRLSNDAEALIAASKLDGAQIAADSGDTGL